MCGRGSKSLDPLDLSRLLCCILFHESGKPIRHPKIPGMKLRHRTNARCQCAQTTTDLWFSFEQIFIGGDDSLKQVTRVKRGIHERIIFKQIQRERHQIPEPKFLPDHDTKFARAQFLNGLLTKPMACIDQIRVNVSWWPHIAFKLFKSGHLIAT